MAVSRDANGWTVVTPSGDSRLIYVSNSEGNDSNDGLSDTTPKQTIAAGLALMRDGYPDHLLLKRGDTWTEEQVAGSGGVGRSADEPALISAYGTGARPKITARTMIPIRLVGSYDYVCVIGLHADGTTRVAGDNWVGVSIVGRGGSILLEDCLIDEGGSGVSITRALSGDEWSDITIRRNVIVNSWNDAAHSQGLFADYVNTLTVEENTFDHNGWNDSIVGGEATAFNHNMYITHNTRDVVIRDNIISRGASAGLKFQPNGGTHYVTNNLFARNEIVGTIGGGQDGKIVPGQGAVIYWNDNVMVEAASTGRNVLGGLTSSNLEGGSFRNNILANAAGTTAQSYRTAGYEAQGVGVDNFTVDGNVIYNWKGRVEITANASNLRFTNNVLQEPNQPSDRNLAEVSTGYTLASASGNRYHSNADPSTWFEINNVDTDYAGWIAETGEAGSSNTETTFVDPSRTATTYATDLEYADYDAFIAAISTQSKANWDSRFTAEAINYYIREGFSTGDITVSYIDDTVLDGALSILDTDANVLHICSAEPDTYAEATSTYTLGNKTSLSVGSPAARTPSGRKVTVAAITDGTVTSDGTASHWAIVDTVGEVLLVAGALSSSQGVTSGNAFTLGAFDIGIPGPA